MVEVILLLKAAFLGIVEGITEFLPISSTGHMILVDHYVKLSNNHSFTTAFEVIIQLGAILSVVVYFWNKLWPFSGTRTERTETWQIWFKVLVAVLPAIVIGLKFDDLIEEKLFNATTVSIALIFYGIILILIEIYNKKKNSFAITNVRNIGYDKAFMIGIFQCLAMVPGTSRSASTIIGGILLGLNRAVAAEFSFFLAIPTMMGATLLKIIKEGFSFSVIEWISIACGFVVSFVVAFAVIKLFMEYIKTKDFKIFGYYRIGLGIVILWLLFFNQ